MVLNSLLIGLEPKTGKSVRANDPVDILTAVSDIKLQLRPYQLETQEFSTNRNPTPTLRKPIHFENYK